MRATTTADRLGDLLKRKIELRTSRRVRRLDIREDSGTLVVRACAPTYYCKQLVIQAVLDALSLHPEHGVRFEVCVEAPAVAHRSPR